MSSDPATGPRRPTASRRGFLGGVALLGASGIPARARAVRRTSDRTAELSVMTRNCYLGVDLFRLLRARTVAGVRRIAGRMLVDIERRPFPPRAVAIAAEVAATRPDVLGVQEAALVRTQARSDFGKAHTANARVVMVDFLDVLVTALADRGLAYEVAASEVTSDVEVPADVAGGVADVRLTDRDALLVRKGVDVGKTRTGTYRANLEIPVGGDAVPVYRGYCVADVSLRGLDATVVTTHLESADTGVRLQQALELLQVLPADRPVVLAGDVNSGPGGSEGAYGLLTQSLVDAHAALHAGSDGYTCCQDADLRNDRSELSRRVDVVLSRGLRPVAAERVGADPSERVDVVVDGGSGRLWPSDHAGVVATFAAPAPPTSVSETATPASTPAGTSAIPLTPSTQPSAGPTSGSPAGRTTSPPLSGFGPAATVLALVLAAAARRRR